MRPRGIWTAAIVECSISPHDGTYEMRVAMIAVFMAVAVVGCGVYKVCLLSTPEEAVERRPELLAWASLNMNPRVFFAKVTDVRGVVSS